MVAQKLYNQLSDVLLENGCFLLFILSPINMTTPANYEIPTDGRNGVVIRNREHSPVLTHCG